MINRENYADTRAYLSYLSRVMLNDEKTIKKRRGEFRHLLEWADATPFPKARTIDPTFQAYISTARADGKSGTLSASTMVSACNTARSFFEWAKMEHPGRYKPISASWINTIRPGKARGAQADIRSHDFYSFEDIETIARWQPATLVERRNQAAMVFLYLSAMRADAFVSMPIECFDPVRLTVQQAPARGVRTKNHKAAITTLLNIPGLQGVVLEWDRYIRPRLSPRCMWFAHIDRTGEILTGETAAGEGRRVILTRGIKAVCAKVGLRYFSPHKLRHGHVVYALKLVRDMAGLKAVSQNVMHSNVSITDGIYGQFTGDDVHDLIAGLSTTPQAGDTNGLSALANLVKTIQDSPDLLRMLMGRAPGEGE